MLDVGMSMPDIALEDTSGRPVSLGTYRGQLNVVVYFMRSTSCPVCNAHVKDLEQRSAEYARLGVRILIAVPEGRDVAAQWVIKRNIALQVVTGRKGTPHGTVGLTRRVFGTMQQSGTVLIDRNGVVRYVKIATMPPGGYDKQGLAQALEEVCGTKVSA